MSPKNFLAFLVGLPMAGWAERDIHTLKPPLAWLRHYGADSEENRMDAGFDDRGKVGETEKEECGRLVT